jgi:hypothetical protein
MRWRLLLLRRLVTVRWRRALLLLLRVRTLRGHFFW